MTRPFVPDTPQQKAVLRQCKAARATRKAFPIGSRVTARGATEGPVGVVLRHVLATNAQGGHLTVEWAGGVVGRHGPIGLRRV